MSGQLCRRIGFIASEPAGLSALLLVAVLAYCPAAYAEPVPAGEDMAGPADPAPIPAEGPASTGTTLLSRRDVARPGAPDRVSVLGPAGEPKPLPVRPSSNGSARHH